MNLLLTLHVLLQEKNVTKAASILALTQPAVSNALARLRYIFKDELLVRNGRALALTPKAQFLVGPLDQIIKQAEVLIAGQEVFDPLRTEKQFVVACSDVIEASLLPEVLGNFRKSMPRSSLKFVTLDQMYQEDSLATGAVDLMIGRPPKTLSGAEVELLYQDELVCLFKSSDKKSSKISLESFLEKPHIRIAPMAFALDEVEIALKSLGKNRTVILQVPHFSVAPLILAREDALAVLPARLAKQFKDGFGLTMCRPPIKLPFIKVSYMWHKRTQNDPANIYLRRLLKAGVLKYRMGIRADERQGE
jgi:DNA-binding transcriptional LysR family regulator